MPLDYPMNKHLDGQNVAELKRYKINNVLVDPTGADLVEGIPFYVDADKKWKYFDGTTLKPFGSEGGRKRGNFDASTGAIPTAADASVDPGVEIADGDYFVITVGGTLTGLVGEEELEIGDLLFASTNAPAAATDFYAVQTNIQLADNPVEAENFFAQDILEATPLVLTPTLFDSITAIEIIDPEEGTRLTDSLAITYTLGANGTYESVTIETLVDVIAANIILSGYTA